MVDYLKEHFGTIITAEKIMEDYLRICAEELAADLANCGYGDSNINLTIIDNGDDCFKSIV